MTGKRVTEWHSLEFRRGASCNRGQVDPCVMLEVIHSLHAALLVLDFAAVKSPRLAFHFHSSTTTSTLSLRSTTCQFLKTK
jgi:hypothetical protein